MNEAYSAFAAGYDRMMGDVNYDGWAGYIDGFLREAGAKSALECACGTGSLTVRLGRMGYAMTGSDLSEDMLMVARQKALDAGLRFLPFVRQDMRHIALHKPVDAVISACDGVNYLLDGAEDFFRAAHGALRPGGLLLFDVSSAYKLSTVLANNIFAATGEDWAYIWENTYHPRLRPDGHAAHRVFETGPRLYSLRGASQPAGVHRGRVESVSRKLRLWGHSGI